MIVGGMSDLEYRISAAADWLEATIGEDGHGRAGWGWVPDIPPNPQNTAEVVCAFSEIGRAVPQLDKVRELVRSDAVEHESRGDWAFRALIDVAWRLRALRCVVADPEDPGIVACASALLDAQEPSTGGWRLAGVTGPVSVTATTAATLSLLNLATPSVDTVSAVRKGLAMLIASVLDGDERARCLYASAQIADLLGRREISGLGGSRTERARELALGRVMDALRSGELGIEEEVFVRETATDTWRHMTLPMSLMAVCRAAPERLFDPPFRGGLIELLDLQETAIENVNRGGFRTSREGFVTSYATTQALGVLAKIAPTISERINPARTFDLLCRVDGASHADPQDVVSIAGRPVIMNSWAGVVLMIIGALSGATTAVLAVILRKHLGNAGSRALVIWGAIFVAVGTYGFVAVRLPGTSNGKIAAVVFSLFTALVLPVLTYLVS